MAFLIWRDNRPWIPWIAAPRAILGVLLLAEAGLAWTDESQVRTDRGYPEAFDGLARLRGRSRIITG